MATSSQAKRKRSNTMVRITSNYASLCVTFLLGFVWVRLLLQLGDDAYGLVVLLGAGTGLIGVLRGTLRESMIPELGAAYHDERDGVFDETYSGALVFSFVTGLIALLILLIIGVCLSGMRIPTEMLPAARWFLAAKAVQAFMVVLLAPALNMYVVAERMVAHNGWLTAERIGDTFSVAIVLSLFGGAPSSQTVVVYGVISSCFAVLIYVLATAMVVRDDRRLVPWPRRFTRKAFRRLSSSIGWNACVALANAMYTKLDAFIMNLAFGLFGNVVFGIATQLCFYVRRATIGLVNGIDAVAARISRKSGSEAVLNVMHRTAQLQAIVVIPVSCWLVIWCESIIWAWVGSRLREPETTVPAIALLVRIFVMGVAARSLSEGWMKVVAGAGYVRKFAPALLGAALINPLLVGLLLYILPDKLRLNSPAMAFSALLVPVHLVILPRIIARHFGINFFEVVGPLLRPLIATCLSLSVLMPWIWRSDVRFASFAFMSALFVPVYATATFFVALSVEDRRSVYGFVNRKVLSVAQ